MNSTLPFLSCNNKEKFIMLGKNVIAITTSVCWIQFDDRIDHRTIVMGYCEKVHLEDNCVNIAIAEKFRVAYVL